MLYASIGKVDKAVERCDEVSGQGGFQPYGESAIFGIKGRSVLERKSGCSVAGLSFQRWATVGNDRDRLLDAVRRRMVGGLCLGGDAGGTGLECGDGEELGLRLTDVDTEILVAIALPGEVLGVEEEVYVRIGSGVVRDNRRERHLITRDQELRKS